MAKESKWGGEHGGNHEKPASYRAIVLKLPIDIYTGVARLFSQTFDPFSELYSFYLYIQCHGQRYS